MKKYELMVMDGHVYLIDEMDDAISVRGCDPSTKEIVSIKMTPPQMKAFAQQLWQFGWIRSSFEIVPKKATT